MTNKEKEMYRLLSDSSQLAADVLAFAQSKFDAGNGVSDDQTEKMKAALGIAFTTLCKATDVHLHDIVDMVITIYKNTEVEKFDD